MGLASAVAMPLALAPRPEAIRVWEDHVRAVEARIEAELAQPDALFFAYERLDAPARGRAIVTLARGDVFVAAMPAPSGATRDAPGALVHHWLGAITLPGATLEDVLAFAQDYDHHAEVYRDVVDSRLVAREGDRFHVFLKLRRSKVITVLYDTEHEVHYRRLAAGRAFSRSTATRIAELADPGTPRERARSAAGDRGFLWRLNSYWRFREDRAAVTVECESVSLSRDIPWLLVPLVRPFVTSIPRESLERTLTDMRAGVARRRASTPGSATRSPGA